MKKVLILTVVMLFVAGAAFAGSGKGVMPYWWASQGAFSAAPVVFCAHNPNLPTGTADVILTWYDATGGVVITQTKFFNGPGHQRFDVGSLGVGFATVSWNSYDCGTVGCTGVEWYGNAGSLYHVPFVD